MSGDRISNLPCDVSKQILECLPLREAAKTSILSRQWRYEWASISQLILDEAFFDGILNSKLNTSAFGGLPSLEYWIVIYRILLTHRGYPLRKFVLRFPEWIVTDADVVYDWIRGVCTRGIKNLTVVELSRIAEIPSCLFSCVALTHFSFTYMTTTIFTLPPKFSGFPCLVSLKLSWYYMSLDGESLSAVENLISKCPLLEILYFDVPYIDSSLSICAPKLKDLSLNGYINDFSLEGTTLIKRLDMNIHCSFQNSYNLSDFFSCLPRVEEVILGKLFFLATLHYDFIPPKNDLTQLKQLKHLHLVEAPLNLSTTLSFINRWLFDTSPRLEQLYVEVAVHNDRDVADEFGIDGSCSLKCLNNVQIVNVSGLKNELQLIKLILSSLPMLREMRIEFGTKLVAAEDRYRFRKESLKYTRASPHAKVIFQEKN